MMETMIPPQVGMRLRTEKGERKEAIKKERKGPNKIKIKITREKERRDNVTILYHTSASK